MLKTKQMTKITFPVIPDEVLIDLRISGTFYKALSQTLLAYTQSLTDQEFTEIRQKLKDNGDATDLKQLTVMLLTSLVFSLEKSAEEQKLTKIVETEIPDEPTETNNISES